MHARERYFFSVVARDSGDETPDLVECDHGFLFSDKLVVQVKEIIEDHADLIEAELGRYALVPRLEFPCLNSSEFPAPGAEVIPASEVPLRAHVGYVRDLPRRLIVSDVFIERVVGRGFSGIGFVEVNDKADVVRPRYSFLKRLEVDAREDILLQAIIERCRRVDALLLDITITESDFELRQGQFRCIWYLTTDGPEHVVECENSIVFLNESEKLLEEIEFR